MSDADVVYSDAANLCDFYGGSLAIVDDCNLLGEIAQYIEANGEHTRDMSSNWSTVEVYDTREAASSYIVWHNSVIKSYVNDILYHVIV